MHYSTHQAIRLSNAGHIYTRASKRKAPASTPSLLILSCQIRCRLADFFDAAFGAAYVRLSVPQLGTCTRTPCFPDPTGCCLALVVRARIAVPFAARCFEGQE